MDAAYAFDTPEAFFEHVVALNHFEFTTRPSDLRLAMNTAISCLSMRDWMLAKHDHLFAGLHVTARIGKYNDYLDEKEHAFASVREIANASKHRILKSGFSATDMKVDFFRCGDPVGISLRPIKVRWDDGTEDVIDMLLYRVIVMWTREIGFDPARLRRGGKWVDPRHRDVSSSKKP